MSVEEVEAFRRQPGWQEAIELRRIDDRAKVVGLVVPHLQEYRGQLERVVARARARPEGCALTRRAARTPGARRG